MMRTLFALMFVLALVAPAVAQVITGCGGGDYTGDLPPVGAANTQLCTIQDAPTCITGQLQVAGGGSTMCLVQSNGSNWVSVGGAARSGWAGSSNAVVSNSAANFFTANGISAPVASTLEGDVSTLAPTIAVIRNLKCTLTTVAGVVTVAGGTSYVIALRRNIASSALTCTITAAISTCVDTTHSVTTAIGDQLDYIDTPTGTPTALVVKCSVEIDS